MIVIVRPAPFSNYLGFKGLFSTGRIWYGVYGNRGGLAPRRGARCRTQLPHYNVSITVVDHLRKQTTYPGSNPGPSTTLQTENRMGEPP